MAEQRHTEEAIAHTAGQQNTGNHHKPGVPEAGAADRIGGTRTGVENVEPRQEKPVGQSPRRTAAVPGLHEVEPERDERNRL